MTIKEILNKTKHRPWELPKGKWRYYQEWNKALFLHWEVSLEELQKFIPKELEIELFEGKPWVSIVAFDMEKIRPRNLPAFPPISDFHEINIRTYVRYNDKPGVYFLSIEGGKIASCKLAKKLSGLPYRYSTISRKKGQYFSSNKPHNDRFEIEYQIGEKIEKTTPLDQWLIERYSLFQNTKNALNSFDIHHLPWPIFELELHKVEINFPRFDILLNNSPNKVNYSSGVQVMAWGKVAHPNSNQFYLSNP